MRKPLAITGLAVLAIAVGLSAWLWTRRDVEVVLVHPEIPPERWQAYLQAVQQAAPPPAEAVNPLLTAVAAHNRAEVHHGLAADGATLARLGAASNTLSEAAWQFIQARTPEEYLQLGRLRGLELIDRLEALLAHVAQGNEPLPTVLAAADPPPVVRQYIEAGGAFVLFAEQGGFVEGGRLVPHRISLLQALFIHHWLAPLRHRYAPLGFVRADEQEWLQRWRAEWQRDGSLPARLRAIEALRGVTGYPADLNAGVLLYQAGRFAEAAEHFARAAGPLATRYRRMAERAQRR